MCVGRIIKDAQHSPSSIRAYPVKDRKIFHNGTDYAAHCMRIYTARMKWDGLVKDKRHAAENTLKRGPKFKKVEDGD
jgi:hypothetical protein